MNTEIIEFYNQKGYPPSEIVKRGVDRFGLTVHGIEAAMISKFNNQDGIPDNKLVWEVWELAKTLDGQAYEKNAQERYEAVKKMRRMEVTLAFYRGIVFAGILAGIVYAWREFVL